MLDIGIVGASGLVGEKLTEIIADKLDCNLRLFGNKSVGKQIIFRTKKIIIEPTQNLTNGNIDYALFCAGNDVSQSFVPKAVANGTTCIDNSSAFRLDGDVPLVVTDINGEQIKNAKIIANPNCSTIQVALALNPLLQFEPTSVTAVTYQSVSGAGKDALDDLKANSTYGKLKALPHPICDNLIPQIGEITQTGYTTEEVKMQKELCKILSLQNLAVNSFCVRVPITVCHGVFVNVKLNRDFSLQQIRNALQMQNNVLVFDNPNYGVYPMPTMLRNTKYVGVGRIVRDVTGNGINMWVVADNLLRGASYNAYEILEKAIFYNKQNGNPTDKNQTG